MSSKILNNNSVIDIKLTYSIKNPFDIFGLSTIRVTDRKRQEMCQIKNMCTLQPGAKYIILIRNVHIC